MTVLSRKDVLAHGKHLSKLDKGRPQILDDEPQLDRCNAFDNIVFGQYRHDFPQALPIVLLGVMGA